MKKWYQSRIIILNIISAVLEIMNLLMNTPIIPVQYAGVMTLSVNALTILFRYLSKGTAIGRGSAWVVKDEATGLFLVSYTENPLTPIWGAESAAMEFDELNAKILAGRIGPGVIGLPKRP